MNTDKSSNRSEKFWDDLNNACIAVNAKYNGEANIVFHADKKQDFLDMYKKNYLKIKNQYMTKDTPALDSHKQAAIFVISALESGVLEETSISNKYLMGIQGAILNVAMSYLTNSIKQKAKDLGLEITDISLPYALACNTSYFGIMCRILYYEHPKRNNSENDYVMQYNILDWADRFFLIEYIILLQNNIDPLILKDEIL